MDIKLLPSPFQMIRMEFKTGGHFFVTVKDRVLLDEDSEKLVQIMTHSI